MGRLENIYEGDWSTVSLTATALGLTVRERFERFKVEAMSELVLRLAGGLMVAGSTLLWLVLPLEASADQIVSHSLLATLFTATGLVVYAYGTRGFRRQLSLDAKRGTLALTKINMNDQGRVVRSIRLNEIESLFLRRPAGRTGFASLYVRVAGQDSPLLALTGATEELEQIHEDLCEIIQTSETDVRQGSGQTAGRFLEGAAVGVSRHRLIRKSVTREKGRPERRPLVLRAQTSADYIMPPMPPMSGMPAPAPLPSFCGLSATIASVVISRPAIEEASSSAVRTTFAGSMTP